MAQQTQLHVHALPGITQTFAAKVASIKSGVMFTELSVMATPGGRHTFVAKDEAAIDDQYIRRVVPWIQLRKRRRVKC